MPELRVADCMHRGVFFCAPDTSVTEVASTMGMRGISAIVVVEDGVAVGLISQTDLVNGAFVQPYLPYWRGLGARHLMSTPVISVGPDATLGEAIRLLRRHRIHRLVVTQPSPEGERPLGILSLTDVVRALGTAPAAEDEREAAR